jgi:hypothetical protein
MAIPLPGSSSGWGRTLTDVVDRGRQAYAGRAWARCAFWLIFNLQGKGKTARANGWLAYSPAAGSRRPRLRRAGVLLLPVAMEKMFRGELEASYADFDHAAEIGERFGDQGATPSALRSTSHRGGRWSPRRPGTAPTAGLPRAERTQSRLAIFRLSTS